MCNLETIEQFVISFRPGGFLFRFVFGACFCGSFRCPSSNTLCCSFFFQAGQGKPDKAVFVEILTSRNFAQLRATLDAYKTVSIDDIRMPMTLSCGRLGQIIVACFLHFKYSIFSEVL